MSLKDDELARRDGGTIEVRPDPLRLSWSFASLATADAHVLDARFACSVRVADTPADRRIFVEFFLGSRDSADAETLVEHFARALRAELQRLAAGQNVVQAIDGGSREAWIGALTKAANAVAFACGLEILPPFQLELESPSLQRQKYEAVARARAEERTAGQLQHLQRAGELLRQFQELRQAAPDLPAGQLLQRINPADRGLTLEALLLASSRQAGSAPLWAVAGPNLVKIDSRSVPPRLELFKLPTNLGPLRSVQPAAIDGRAMLFIGARSGVMLVDPENASETREYACPGLDSPLGFNRVVCEQRMIWASHSDAGIVGWRHGDGTHPEAIFAEAAEVSPAPGETVAPEPGSGVSSAVSSGAAGASVVMSISQPAGGSSAARGRAGARNLQLLDDRRLIYSVGADLVVRHGPARSSVASPSRAEIIAILPGPGWVAAVHQDGAVAIVERANATIVDVRQRGTGLSAASVMPWLGDVRLLLATDQGPVDCIGLDDPLVTEYFSAHRGLKMLSATGDQLAAVSPDRQRVILWSAWDGQRPLGEVHVTSQTRHRIADIEFGG